MGNWYSDTRIGGDRNKLKREVDDAAEALDHANRFGAPKAKRHRLYVKWQAARKRYIAARSRATA